MDILEKIDLLTDAGFRSATFKDTKKFRGGKVGKASDTTRMECMECGHKFKKKIGPRTVEVRCPKCKGYDTDLAYESRTSDIGHGSKKCNKCKSLTYAKDNHFCHKCGDYTKNSRRK